VLQLHQRIDNMLLHRMLGMDRMHQIEQQPFDKKQQEEFRQ